MSGIPRARTAICPVCQEEFKCIKDQNGKFGGRIKLQKYCSKACWSIRATKYIKCGNCGKEIKTTASENKQYCNMECRNEAYKYKEAEECGAWKGDNASYSAKHKWVCSKYEKSRTCDECGCDGKIEWANISGEYKRERDDWRNLCKACHFEYDKERHRSFKRYK